MVTIGRHRVACMAYFVTFNHNYIPWRKLLISICTLKHLMLHEKSWSSKKVLFTSQIKIPKHTICQEFNSEYRLSVSSITMTSPWGALYRTWKLEMIVVCDQLLIVGIYFRLRRVFCGFQRVVCYVILVLFSVFQMLWLLFTFLFSVIQWCVVEDYCPRPWGASGTKSIQWPWPWDKVLRHAEC